MKLTYFRYPALCIFVKMETHRQILNTFIRSNQLANTQQDLKIYCSNHYVRKTSRNLIRGPHLLNRFIASNNDVLEAAIMHMLKVRLKKIIFASTYILEYF